jgi:hypothetical protein
MRAGFAAATLLLISTVSATPMAAQQQMRSYHCIATSVTPGTTHMTVYVSQLIPLEAGQQSALSGAWATYIKSNYHLQTISSAVCQPLATNPAMQEQALTMEENVWKNAGWDVVHIVWKPGQTSSASSSSGTSMYGTAATHGGVPTPPLTAAPSASSGPEPRASYCYSDLAKPTIYFSDPFDTAGLASATAWQNAFSKMLSLKYAYKGAVTCKNSNTILSAQSAILEQRDKLQGKQFVDTDWTYEPPAPSDTAH